MVGNPNLAASFQMVYTPADNTSAAVGAGMANMFAASGAVMMVGAASGAMPPGALADTVSRGQTTMLVGSMPIPTMPPNYKEASSSFGFMKMSFE
jgi:hypothetical protein